MLKDDLAEVLEAICESSMSITKLWDRIEQVNIEKNNVIVQHPLPPGGGGIFVD